MDINKFCCKLVTEKDKNSAWNMKSWAITNLTIT